MQLESSEDTLDLHLEYNKNIFTWLIDNSVS